MVQKTQFNKVKSLFAFFAAFGLQHVGASESTPSRTLVRKMMAESNTTRATNMDVQAHITTDAVPMKPAFTETEDSTEAQQRCACENPGHATLRSCTSSKTCTCNGKARLGYGSRWSQWKDVSGSIPCTNSAFGGDPWPGQAKECQCEAQGVCNDGNQYCKWWTGFCSWHTWVQNTCPKTCNRCPEVVTAPPYPAASPSSNEVVGDIQFRAISGAEKIDDEGTGEEGVKGPGNGYYWMFRPLFMKFKSCTGNECEDCHSDAECGWKRNDYGEFTHLDTADNKEHVAEFWADCASQAQARWYLDFRDECDGRTAVCEAGAFQNADIKVYFAEEGGNMKGELQAPTRTFPQDGFNRIEYTLGQMATGSTRLYVVINAKDVSKKVQIGMNVNVKNVPDLVDDCMAHKMCVNDISDEGSDLRNDNAVQLQCLKNELNGDAALVADCQSWTNCLDANPAHKGILQAMLEAGLSQTSGTLLAEREKTPDGEVTGECANPADDDPESWECECSAALYDACADRWADLAACIKEKMCASNKVCANWKQDKGCPGSLLSKANLSMQESQPMMRAFPAGAGLQGQGEEDGADEGALDESLQGKRSC